VLGELRAVCAGNITTLDAVSGTAFKAALTTLPLVLAPLGLAALPVLIATQIGGRWALTAIRARDARLVAAIAEDSALVKATLAENDRVQASVTQVFKCCDDTDQLFREIVGQQRPALRLVRS
jgi:hypothetical protein